MPFRIRVVDNGRLVLVRATGPADERDWEKLLAAPACGRSPPPDLLIDLRQRRDLPSTEMVRSVMSRLAERTEGFRTVALVVRPGAQFGVARIASTFAGLEGATVEAFLQAREALDWIRARGATLPAS